MSVFLAQPSEHWWIWYQCQRSTAHHLNSQPPTLLPILTRAVCINFTTLMRSASTPVKPICRTFSKGTLEKVGIKPRTFYLQTKCSNQWAMSPYTLCAPVMYALCTHTCEQSHLNLWWAKLHRYLGDSYPLIPWQFSWTTPGKR